MATQLEGAIQTAPLPPPPAIVAPPLTAGQRLHRLIVGPDPVTTVGEEVSPYPEPIVDETGAPHLAARYGRFVAAALVGGSGALLIVASASVWYVAQPTWRLTLPFIPHPGSSFSSIATFIVGLALMVVGWLLLIGRAERAPVSPRARLIAVIAVGCLWSVPIMLGTPLLSHDVYSYAAQGEMASRGIDPTSNGPEVLRYGWYLRQADWKWHSFPAPYGPVAIESQKLAVQLTDHVASASVFGLRVVALAGILMAAVGVGLIAASYRRSAAVAIALGIANPLVLLHLLGGSHNDALMLGFLALGFAAFLRKHKLLAVVLVACATGVKLTAAPALLFMAWNWSTDPAVTYARRIRDSALVVGAAGAIVAALCLFVGIGGGWIAALQGTGKSVSTYSLPTKFAYVAVDVLQWVGIHPSTTMAIAVCRLMGLALAGFLSFLLLMRSPRIGLVRAFALSSLAIVMFGPVVWPWYLATGFALLAASGVGRWRPTYIVMLVAATALVWPASISPLASVQHYQNGITPFVIAAVIAVCYIGQRVAARRSAGAASAPIESEIDPEHVAALV